MDLIGAFVLSMFLALLLIAILVPQVQKRQQKNSE